MCCRRRAFDAAARRPGLPRARRDAPTTQSGTPQYNFTREEDINIANGDPWVPQAPPPACAGALHTVDVAGFGSDAVDPAYYKIDPFTGEVVLQDPSPRAAPERRHVVTVPASTPTDNPTFVDIDASPYEGQQTPICDTKLVPLANGRSIVPTFNVFTDVPLPGRFWGLLVDDLTFSSNKHQINYGEKAGIPFAPVGIYDYTNRLVYTTESDYSGLFDVLLPSTDRISCPTPSGVCAKRLPLRRQRPRWARRTQPELEPAVPHHRGRVRGVPRAHHPGRPRPDPGRRDHPAPRWASVQVQCPQEATVPQLFAVDKPYTIGGGPITINGLGFGARRPEQCRLARRTPDRRCHQLDRHADRRHRAADGPFGPHQLSIQGRQRPHERSAASRIHVMDPFVPTPFPSTGVLSNFNTGEATTTSATAGPRCAGTVFYASDARQQQQQARVRTGTGCAYDSWRSAPNAVYNADQEAYFTFIQPLAVGRPSKGLLLKYSNTAWRPRQPQQPRQRNGSRSRSPTAAGTVQIRTKTSGRQRSRRSSRWPTRSALPATPARRPGARPTAP